VWLVGPPGSNTNGFHASRLTAVALGQQVSALRAALDLGSAPAGTAPPLPGAALHALYQSLLGPLAPQLKGVRSLLVATDGPLASLPLAALLTEPPTSSAAPAWLVQQMAVTQLPAASALQALRRVRQPVVATQALLGFGDPLFRRDGAAVAEATGQRNLVAVQAMPLGKTAGRYDAEWGFRYADVPPLPDTRTELLAIAKALGANAPTDLLLGAAATRRAVLAADLHDRRVVAFATHGLMPGELPGISKPALAMAADADERESPLLELDDVLTLKLNAQWVLLSACNTAAGEAADGAAGGTNSGAMSGLVRGFFFAGTRSVLATHWAVESASAAALSSATFQAGGTTRAEALRQAQLGLIQSGNWSHPFYWAPYALFGDPAQ
jgi:CHAT domain-containing protein